MGTNMYPASALLSQTKDESIMALPVDELIEKADGFAGVFPGMHLTSILFLSHHVNILPSDPTVFNIIYYQSTSMRLSSGCKQGSIFVG